MSESERWELRICSSSPKSPDISSSTPLQVGLPAKSNVSGALIVVIPNVMGMCIYSPRLDRSRNSVRGVQFCKLFTERFVFHQFDPSDRSRDKIDPRRKDFHETKVCTLDSRDDLIL